MKDTSSSGNRDSGALEHDPELAIVLGSVFGGCVALLAIGAVIYALWRRKWKGSIFTRTATPLEDAEFESWRIPSKQLHWHDKYNVLPEPSAPAPTRRPPAARRKHHKRQLDRLSRVTEKDAEYECSNYACQPKPSRTSGRDVDPAHVRNKSSLSLQDRPPTPYTPTSNTASSGPGFPIELPGSRPVSISHRNSSHVHYPSISEASDFHFGFQQENKQCMDEKF